MSRILFVCGSPRGEKSSSRITAEHLCQTLDHPFEFVDVVSAALSDDPLEREPAFEELIDKMSRADAVIWTTGAYCWFVPAQLQGLLDKLFAQGIRFDGKLSATVMTSAYILDDFALTRIRRVSEQLGMHYLGEVSAQGGLYTGYMNEEDTEAACRTLAGQLDRALDSGYRPPISGRPIPAEYLSPSHVGQAFAVDEPSVDKAGTHPIVVISGTPLGDGTASAAVVELIRRRSRCPVEVVELAPLDIKPCLGCLHCDLEEEARCVLHDDYAAVLQQVEAADGLIFIGNGASTLVDLPLKRFIDRSWGLGHRPTLVGKYGLSVVTGSGELGVEAARYVGEIFRGMGVYQVAALSEGAGSPEELKRSLAWALGELERAMEERWQRADQFTHRSIHLGLRELVANAGALLRADWVFFKQQGLFDWPKTYKTAAFYWLFGNRGLRDKMMGKMSQRILARRAERLERRATE